MEGWQTIPLGELVDQSRGISYGIVQPGDHVLNGIPIVRVSDLKGVGLSIDSPMRVRPEIEAPYSRTRLRGGELIMSIVGTVGQTAIVDKSLAGWNVARAVAVIPVQEEIGAYWVRLSLRSGPVREYINMRLNTTVQATLNLRDLSNLPIPVPPRNERQAITGVLGALDDKIELNRRMNETLESLARAIFRDWFVDFGPTRAKQGKREPYLAPEIWSLFPDRLDDEGKPEGWESPTFEQLVEAKQGRYIAKSEISGTPSDDHSIPVWGGNGVRGYVSKSIYDQPILWITCRGSNCGLIGYTESAAWISNNAFGCLAKMGSVYAAYISLLNESFADTISGSAQPQITYSAIRAKPLTFSISRSSWDAFSKAIDPHFDRLLINNEQSRTLAETRDLLLPKLMSGEIRVRDAERTVEDVA